MLLSLTIVVVSACSKTEQSAREVEAALQIAEPLTEKQTDDIVLIGRVWGFVKYHHPAYSSKRKDADADYLTLLGSAVDWQSKDTRTVLLDWIESLGGFGQYDYKTDNCVSTNRFEWIADTSLLGSPLSNCLTQLRRAKRHRNRYVEQTDVNVLFNEPKYADLPDSSLGFRLLGVAKFWNIVDSYSPNRNLTDKDWQTVLPEYVGKALDLRIETDDLFAELISELCDSHATTSYISRHGGRFVPIVAKFAENRLFVCDTCTLVDNPLLAGDEIVSIDGAAPADRFDDIAHHTSHSNRAAMIRDASYLALVTDRQSAEIGYLRAGDTLRTTLSTVESGKFVARIFANLYPADKPKCCTVANDVAYINLGSLTCDDKASMLDTIRLCNKLIVDLRTYPSEYNLLLKLLPDCFFSENRQIGTTFLPQADLPGCMRKIASMTGKTNNPDNLYKGRIAVIVNAQTQSMAEYFAMALQTVPDAITVGSTTAGADGNVSTFALPYNSTTITGLGICYPDGTNAQRAGVKIDYWIEPSAESMIECRDEVLQKAIELLQSR